jgi:hypothetical protein
MFLIVARISFFSLFILCHLRSLVSCTHESSNVSVKTKTNHILKSNLKQFFSLTITTATTIYRIFCSWRIWELSSRVCVPLLASCSRIVRWRLSSTWRGPPTWRRSTCCLPSDEEFATWTGNRKPFCFVLLVLFFVKSGKSFY